jgi:hypothetical protein
MDEWMNFFILINQIHIVTQKLTVKYNIYIYIIFLQIWQMMTYEFVSKNTISPIITAF